eukprot:gene22518-28651_t
MSPSAVVRRDGNKQTVDAEMLTIGDIVFLQPGDIVPADARVLRAVGLSVLEAPLTGEAHPITKTDEPVSTAEVPLAERKCMVYSGTQVLKGTAICVVVAVGSACEMGRISGMLAAIEMEKTPLLVQLERFGLILSIIIICLAFAAFGIAYARQYSVAGSLGLAIGIAVAAIPEGLPSCITVTFAIGVRHMADRQAIVKSLPAVETLGSVSVICSDKTGTLTINKMTAKRVITTEHAYDLSDDGQVVGVNDAQDSMGRSDFLFTALLPGILCNDAAILLEGEASDERNASIATKDDLKEETKEERVDSTAGHFVDIHLGEGEDSLSPEVVAAEVFSILGEPTETCLLSLASALTDSSAAQVRAFRRSVGRVGEVPFDSSAKYMATLHWVDRDTAARLQQITAASGGSTTSLPLTRDVLVKVVLVKGAPERIISLCEPADGADSPLTMHWMHHAEVSAARGMRVLGLAFRFVADDFQFSGEPLKSRAGFTMSALVGIMDPPRPEAIVAVGQAQRAGICVKMITGDHPVTAAAIGKMLGLKAGKKDGTDLEAGGEGDHVLTGNDLDCLIVTSMVDFDRAVVDHDIFARTTPEHKLRIVQSLQRQGFVCCMTGDGVNDAPALKAANIGVAMGITGTEVAKDAANMILLDDNFATIVEAIRVGRCTYNNLIKIITFVLPSNGGQAFSILAALIIGVEVPITALQVLWVNMVTSVTLGLVLAFDKVDDDILNDRPRRPNKRVFGRFLTWRLIYVTTLVTVAVLGVFHWAEGRGLSLHALRTVSVNTLTMMQVFYVFNCRNLRHNVGPRRLFGGNPWLYVGILAVAVFQVVFTYAPPLQYIFGSAAIDGISWGKVVLFSMAVFVLVEAEKVLSTLLAHRRERYAAANRGKRRPHHQAIATVTVRGLC